MTSTTIAASPTKLRNGSWGAKTSADVSVGDIVTISTRAGKSWDARVTHVIWTGKSKYSAGQVSICATERVESRPAPTYSSISHGGGNCSRCCQTATRRAQIWEDCDFCGAEPVYR